MRTSKKGNLISCDIQVTKLGSQHHYTGMYKSTTDAVMDALKIFGLVGKIKVRRIA